MATGLLLLSGIALLVVLFNGVFGGEDVAADEVTSTTATVEGATSNQPSNGAVVSPPEPIEVATVSASTSFNEQLGPGNLIDGDPATYWNDASLHGEGAELELTFSAPTSITELVVQNVPDEVTFTRNYRIKGYEIIADDLPLPIVGEMADTREPQTIGLATEATTRLTIHVTSTYSSESVADRAAFEELAVAELTVIGQDASD